MAIIKMMVVSEAIHFEQEGEPFDVRVTVRGTDVVIEPHDSDEPVSLIFLQAEWQALDKFVREQWPEPAATTPVSTPKPTPPLPSPGPLAGKGV